MSTQMQSAEFPRCASCGADDWRPVFESEIRAGAPGSWVNATIGRCGGCNVDRLQESFALDHRSYESEAYRAFIAQDHDVQKHYQTHDELARYALEALWPIGLREKVVADVGCGGGALLDHVRGLASTLIAIEPAQPWAASLRERGYELYPGAAEAAVDWAGKVDVLFSTQVIEHVEEPAAFLRDIRALLAPGGIAIISTPNRNDILMELLPDVFPPFFYRVQHRWAFDGDSLMTCAHHAGLVGEIRYMHRYGLANTMHWLRDGVPKGRAAMPPLDATIDRHWQAWLEQNGRADNLCLIARRAEGE